MALGESEFVVNLRLVALDQALFACACSYFYGCPSAPGSQTKSSQA